MRRINSICDVYTSLNTAYGGVYVSCHFSHFCTEKSRCFLLKAATTFTTLSLLLPPLSAAQTPASLHIKGGIVRQGRHRGNLEEVKISNAYEYTY